MSLVYEADSAINGLGCFCDSMLPEDLWIPVTTTITSEESEYNIYGEDGVMELPDYPYCFLNHSPQPNCELVYSDDEVLYLRTLQGIPRNRELTFDYSGEGLNYRDLK